MKTTSFHSREFPTMASLIRFILLIAILCFLTSIVSTAQVPTKTCCKAHQHVNFEEIKEFLNVLDSLGGIENCNHKIDKCKKSINSSEPGYAPEWPFSQDEENYSFYYYDGFFLVIAIMNRKNSTGQIQNQRQEINRY